MKLKGLSIKELRKLELEIKKDIKNTKITIATEQRKLKELRNKRCQVRTKGRQIEYKDNLWNEFAHITVVEA